MLCYDQATAGYTCQFLGVDSVGSRMTPPVGATPGSRGAAACHSRRPASLRRRLSRGEGVFRQSGSADAMLCSRSLWGVHDPSSREA
jgi:hypothetical protein